MLAHDGVVLAHHHLFSGVRAARVLLRGVVKAGVSRADELDLDRGRLCHDLKLSNLKMFRKRRPVAFRFRKVKRPVCVAGPLTACLRRVAHARGSHGAGTR